MSDVDNGTVRYSVKELLARMDAKLDKAIEKLDSKASDDDHAALEKRVSALERRFWIGIGALSAIEAGLGIYLQLHHG